MTHIISRQKGFSFIHIPKNGGSTIRDTFLQFDDCDRKFAYDICEHEDLGMIAQGHLPLWVIAKYHPEEFGHIRATWTSAITRDPVGRFYSAMAQRAREFLDLRLEELDKAQFQTEADRIMQHLEASPELPEAEFCHFTRQRDFVFLDGERVVDSTYPLEWIDMLLAELSERCSVEIVREFSNRTEVTAGGQLGQVARSGWKVVKPMLPQGLRTNLRKRFRGLVVQSGTKVAAREEDPRLTAFIRDFYASDFDLHAEAVAGVAQAATARLEPGSRNHV